MQNRIVTEIPARLMLTKFHGLEKANKRVAAYARVSTDHEDQETSLAAQTEFYRKKILGHPGWVFVDIYVDEGISGLTTKKRDGFNRLVADCLAGRIDLVLTKSISRFARNTVDSITTIRKLRDKGVGVYFEKENIFTMDSKGEFLLTVMSSLAQEESRSISENVVWGQRKRLADGKVSIAYSRFLGYDKSPEKFTMVVNREQAVTVRRIYRMFLQGYSDYRIAAILTDERIRPPGGGKKWSRGTIHRILQNEKYKGDALLQKSFTVDFLKKKVKKNEGEIPRYYVEEDHEAIVSPWLFDYVQKRLAERAEFPGRYSGVTKLSSKVVCGICGSGFTPRPWHSTTDNTLVWQCRNKIKKGPKCQTSNLYDRMLHYVIHDAARTLASKRKVTQTVVEIVTRMADEATCEMVRRWMDAFEKWNVWEMQSDEEDLSLILRRIEVLPEGKMKIHWICGRAVCYRLPGTRTRKGAIRNDR